MPQATVKFRPYQKVIIKDMLNTHTEQLFDGTGTFIKELFHLPQFRGKALVIFNTVVLVVSMDRLSAAETVNNIT